jgi:hypothetical protein
MTRRVLIDEFHVSFLVPRTLAQEEDLAVRRILRSRALRVKLTEHVRQVAGAFPGLAKLTIKVSR